MDIECLIFFFTTNLISLDDKEDINGWSFWRETVDRKGFAFESGLELGLSQSSPHKPCEDTSSYRNSKGQLAVPKGVTSPKKTPCAFRGISPNFLPDMKGKPSIHVKKVLASYITQLCPNATAPNTF